MSRTAFESAESAITAITAGNARFTLVSKKTGARYTYKVQAAKKGLAKGAKPTMFFVSLLTGPDNTGDYTYMGVVVETRGGFEFRTTAKSKVSATAPSAQAIAYSIGAMTVDHAIPGTLEVWHEGTCCRCGRVLTVPESLATGLGPICVGLAA